MEASAQAFLLVTRKSARASKARSVRSEERRVGKESRSGWTPDQAEDGIRDHCVTGVQTCALPICQQAETLVQLAVNLFDRKGAHSRRRQLNGQRNPVQAITDGSERASVLVGDPEVRAGEQGTVGKIGRASCRERE